jgi:HPt (histidine-containing phosphotransfer) domain-containing protein
VRLADTEEVTDSFRQSDRAPQEPLSFGLTLLLDLFDNDRKAIVDLLRIAIAAIRDDVATIAGLNPGLDPEAVVEAAHRLKGTSGTIGAVRLMTLAACLESIAKRRPPERLTPDALHELDVLVGELERDIATVAGEPPGCHETGSFGV